MTSHRLFVILDMELMLRGFYEKRGLNADGVSNEVVLKEFGLNKPASLLYPK